MSDEPAAETIALIGHIEKHVTLLSEVREHIRGAVSEDLLVLGKSARAAVLVAGLLENYYTCAETVFVRISQYFENNLDRERWHRDLLERMTLEMPPIRPRVLTDSVAMDLAELMRFRHFRRYYFGTSYDWTRLDELVVRVERLHVPFLDELAAFVAFLHELIAD